MHSLLEIRWWKIKAVFLPGAGSQILALPPALCRSQCCSTSFSHVQLEWKCQSLRGQEKINLLCFFQVPLHWYFSTLELLIGTTRSDITSVTTQVLMEIKIKESGTFTNHYSFGVVVTFPKIYIFKRHKRPLPNLLATFTCVTLRTPKI